MIGRVRRGLGHSCPRSNRPLNAMEQLEERRLLAGESLVISEFLAINNSSLRDADGEYSDWIEIYNPTDQAVDLDGWHLTDDENDLDKWTFPAETLQAGAFLTVFASNKAVADPRGALHTNFKLSGDGEYLALTGPDSTIVHEYAPSYPKQLADVSYGLDLDGLDVVGAQTPASWFVPTGPELTDAWRQVDFQELPEQWTSATAEMQFGMPNSRSTLGGFTVRDVSSVNDIRSLSSADALLAGEGIASESSRLGVPVINYTESATEGHYEGSMLFPNGGGSNFVTLARATLVVESTAQYTFGALHDDGIRLVIDGETVLEVDSVQGAGDTLSAPVTLSAGDHVLELVKFQKSRPAELELFVAPGTQAEYNDTFRLLGDSSAMGIDVFAIVPDDGVNALAEAMVGSATSVYSRVPFVIDNPELATGLELQVQYNDGFVAYLNGVEVARKNAPQVLSWNALATAERSLDDSRVVETISLDARTGLLRSGENVFAVQGLNADAADETFLFSPQLSITGVFPDNTRFFGDLTPGKFNESRIKGLVGDTEFSVDRGLFDRPINLEITTDTPDAVIRYTIDGSEPSSTNGLVYSGAIRIASTTIVRARAFKTGYISSNADTQTYIFPADIITQSTMSSAITSNAEWGPQMADSLAAIPTVSLVTSNQFTSGQIVNTETATSMELIYPDGRKGFQVDAGIEHFGGTSINFAKKSVRLSFKEIYGPSKLKFDLFGDGATTEFDQILLRAGSHDTAFYTNGTRGIFVRGRWMSDRQLEMGQPAPRGMFVQVYVNGTYWGQYQLMERPNASFMASYFGGEPEEFDALNAATPVDGNNQAWNAMLAAADDYEELQQYMDLENYADYLLLQFFAGNDWDWRASQNWMAATQREGGEGYQFFAWDNDMVLRTGLNSSVVNSGGPGNLWLRVRQHEEFRMMLADRAQKYFYNGGMFTPERAIESIEVLADSIETSVIAELARWGISSYNPASWRENVIRVQQEILAGRAEVVIRQMRDANITPSFAAPEFYIGRTPRHGGQLAAGEQLSILSSTPRIKIYYTTDGSDPRLVGGARNPNALEYTGPLELLDDAVVKTRVQTGRVWSALTEAKFTVNPPATAETLAITEINYHPAEPTVREQGAGFTDEDDFEFIELANISDSPISLAGLRFTDGISFDFSTSDVFTLAAGQRTVLVRNREAFDYRYGPDVLVAGQFEGALRNGGEHLLLVDQLDTPIHDFTYDDQGDWPRLADGGGRTLVVVDVAGDYNGASNWANSSAENGTPGEAEVVVNLPQVTAVAVSSSSWTGDFLAQLTTPDGSLLGYTLDTDSENSSVLPWTDIDQVHVVFSRDITVSEEDLSIVDRDGVDLVELIGLAADGFAYDSATHTATWTLAAPMPASQLDVILNDTPVGDFSIGLLALPGDINGSQTVDLRDVQILRDKLFAQLGEPLYDHRTDVDGSGEINIRDLQVLRQYLLVDVIMAMEAGDETDAPAPNVDDFGLPGLPAIL